MIKMTIVYIYINNEDLFYKSFCRIIGRLLIILHREHNDLM